MHEVIEGHEEHGGPRTLPVAVTMSILAVLVAMATLMGHRAGTEKILLQAQASDQWAYYQAKNIRAHEMQSVADMLASLAPADKEKAGVLREKYVKEGERYDREKDEISDKAKELENERNQVAKREDRFDAAEVLLEIALIICSLTLLTKNKFFWHSGMLVGVVGFVVGLSGFLVR